ncbi:enoyl-CoA hydratase-related protein [Sphingomonas colocasiae]|uniref:Enoyl-CoA hydratase/isomerase family protein n=1 Tax=Sphingomonas colocasiae TaxID=1848973 RepID=A0ABS7PSN1_9SPHN|nr:enoyl-CoA hydratase-related protein [Sphingomonas colocasiae]MBY8824351.1 enoyl-CoA hydratase/isomerase family protein [Sphingomonas colocasiae]
MSEGDTEAPEVLLEMRGHVALITLNRPAQRNAINGAIASAIEGLVRQTEADDAVRAVVLASSHDKVFCAGADLAEISRGNAAALSTEAGGFGGLVRAKRIKPWIAAVGGAAFAGGCELVLACDMIVASEAARFALPEVKRGLFAAAAGPLRLQRVLPRNIALELVATGDPIGADRAYQLGMVNRLVPQDALIDAALDLAAAIAVNAPLAVRESLAIARDVPDLDEIAYWERSKAAEALVFSSDDAREGPLAFLEKREPNWMGR